MLNKIAAKGARALCMRSRAVIAHALKIAMKTSCETKFDNGSGGCPDKNQSLRMLTLTAIAPIAKNQRWLA